MLVSRGNPGIIDRSPLLCIWGSTSRSSLWVSFLRHLAMPGDSARPPTARVPGDGYLGRVDSERWTGGPEAATAAFLHQLPAAARTRTAQIFRPVCEVSQPTARRTCSFSFFSFRLCSLLPLHQTSPLHITRPPTEPCQALHSFFSRPSLPLSSLYRLLLATSLLLRGIQTRSACRSGPQTQTQAIHRSPSLSRPATFVCHHGFIPPQPSQSK